MIHPSTLAEDIIFDRFVDNCCTAEAIDKISKGIKRCKAEGHRKDK
jgi:hypothetical protein